MYFSNVVFLMKRDQNQMNCFGKILEKNDKNKLDFTWNQNLSVNWCDEK